VLGTLGLALAEDVADEERVDNGTMDPVTTVQGYVYTADQSVSGVGFASIYGNLSSVDPDGSRPLNLRVISSGSGSYSHNSSIYIQNNIVVNNEGDFTGSNRKITSKDDISASYEGINFQIPGSFRASSIKLLWMDQTCAKNYAGIISLNSLFDYAKMLQKESTTTMSSDQKDYEAYVESDSSNIASSMDISSKFDGSAHLGATINDVRGESQTMKDKTNSNVLIDEDYKGSFVITKKMAVNIIRTTTYSDEDADDSSYQWLPCNCNAGWDDMAIHDQRYHSAKAFFDCTTCWPPGPCKN
jgi:hypothetical protein